MSKFFAIFLLATTLMQFALSSSSATASALTENDRAVLNFKRRSLLKRAFADLRQAIWHDETFEYVDKFHNELRTWANSVQDDNFKESDFLAQIDVCLNHLNSLKADRTNCDIHRNLLHQYIKLKELSPKDNSELKAKFSAVTEKLGNLLEKQRNFIYAKLNEEVEIFMRDLSDAEKRESSLIIEWYQKFNSEKDIQVKDRLAKKFPELFTEKELNGNTTCMPIE